MHLSLLIGFDMPQNESSFLCVDFSSDYYKMNYQAQLPPIATFSQNTLNERPIPKRIHVSKPNQPANISSYSKSFFCTYSECKYAAKKIPFKFKCRLEQHLLTHRIETRFTCNECGRTFRLKGNLRRHSRMHTTDKTFRCKICHNEFSNVSDRALCYKNHLLTAAFQATPPLIKSEPVTALAIEKAIDCVRLRLYKCSSCPGNKTFTDMGSLRRHKRRHHEGVANKTSASVHFTANGVDCNVETLLREKLCVPRARIHLNSASQYESCGHLAVSQTRANSSSPITTHDIDPSAHTANSVGDFHCSNILTDSVMELLPLGNRECITDANRFHSEPLVESTTHDQKFYNKNGLQFTDLVNASELEVASVPESAFYRPVELHTSEHLNSDTALDLTDAQYSAVAPYDDAAIDLSFCAALNLATPIDLSAPQNPQDINSCDFASVAGNQISLPNILPTFSSNWDPEPGFSFTDLLTNSEMDESESCLQNYPILLPENYIKPNPPLDLRILPPSLH